MKLSKKQIIIILVGMSVGMTAGVLESVSHEYFKPNIDIVGINQSVNTEPKLYIGTKDCNGIAFMNSTGDKICATWNDLHDDIALLKHLNIKNTTTIKWTFTMNSTTTCPDDICQNTTTLTEATNRPDTYPNGTLADVTNKNDCCYYKTTNPSNFWHSTDGTIQPDVVYQKQNKCNQNDIECIKENYPQDYKSSSELTEGTNVCTVGFDCPPSVQKESTDDTQCSGITMQLCEQNKKIIEQQKEILNNQNIELCLQVVKSSSDWETIGNYLTTRGITCQGLTWK